jgi:malate synthase
MSKRSSKSRIKEAYPNSRTLRWVAGNLSGARESLKRYPQRVVPVAALARMFGISTRSLWNWIGRGMLKNRPAQDGAARLKRGVERRDALVFLKHLEEISRPRRKAGFFW